MRQTVLILIVFALVGCGSDPPHVTATDKDKISGAALSISEECRLNATDADVSTVENAVNDLLNAKDKLGDQTFTFSKDLAGVTVQDIMDREAKIMDETGCVPEQQDRLAG